MRPTPKLFIAGAVIIAGLLILRFAFALIHDVVSIIIAVVGAVLVIGGLLFFGKNFRE